MIIFTWILAGIALTGTYLVTVKQKAGFYFWTVANVGFIYVNYEAEIYAQSTLFLAYLGTSIYGIFKWKEEG
ncbi:MAG: nicotinamide mononucleotide transporter [Deltaproteobacteria bacterium]|nr:nicotinamide mononucleotide transporter [Deltaproteobacteria bacterium]